MTTNPSSRPNRRRRVRRVALGALALAVVAAPMAGAASPDSVASQTGCLRTTGGDAGKIFAVAQGASPLRACRDDETPLALSSGDITSVAAGVGLRITSSDTFGVVDAQGAVGVDLAPSFRLPQDCVTTDLPTFHRTTRSWHCLPRPTPYVLPKAVEGSADGPALIADDWANIATPLQIPAGSWAIVAKVGIREDTDSPKTIVGCRLDVSGTPFSDEAFLMNDAASASGYAAGQLTLTALTTQANNFHAVVACNDRGMGNDWTDLHIVATPTGGTTSVAL